VCLRVSPPSSPRRARPGHEHEICGGWSGGVLTGPSRPSSTSLSSERTLTDGTAAASLARSRRTSSSTSVSIHRWYRANRGRVAKPRRYAGGVAKTFEEKVAAAAAKAGTSVKVVTSKPGTGTGTVTFLAVTGRLVGVHLLTRRPVLIRQRQGSLGRLLPRLSPPALRAGREIPPTRMDAHGPCWIRTSDLGIKSPLLYQLS
jgi:hypothetical protein